MAAMSTASDGGGGSGVEMSMSSTPAPLKIGAIETSIVGPTCGGAGEMYVRCLVSCDSNMRLDTARPHSGLCCCRLSTYPLVFSFVVFCAATPVVLTRGINKQKGHATMITSKTFFSQRRDFREGTVTRTTNWDKSQVVQRFGRPDHGGAC
jgi:hypothetical protein